MAEIGIDRQPAFLATTRSDGPSHLKAAFGYDDIVTITVQCPYWQVFQLAGGSGIAVSGDRGNCSKQTRALRCPSPCGSSASAQSGQINPFSIDRHRGGNMIEDGFQFCDIPIFFRREQGGH